MERNLNTIAFNEVQNLFNEHVIETEKPASPIKYVDPLQNLITKSDDFGNFLGDLTELDNTQFSQQNSQFMYAENFQNPFINNANINANDSNNNNTTKKTLSNDKTIRQTYVNDDNIDRSLDGDLSCITKLGDYDKQETIRILGNDYLMSTLKNDYANNNDIIMFDNNRMTANFGGNFANNLNGLNNNNLNDLETPTDLKNTGELVVEFDDSWNDTSDIHECKHELYRPLNLEGYNTDENDLDLTNIIGNKKDAQKLDLVEINFDIFNNADLSCDDTVMENTSIVNTTQFTSTNPVLSQIHIEKNPESSQNVQENHSEKQQFVANRSKTPESGQRDINIGCTFGPNMQAIVQQNIPERDSKEVFVIKDNQENNIALINQ